MIELVATCLFGLEKQLGEEIDALGCKRLDTMDGRVTFWAVKPISREQMFACVVPSVSISASALFPRVPLPSCSTACALCRLRILSVPTTPFPSRGTPFAASSTRYPIAKASSKRQSSSGFLPRMG